MTTLPEAIVGGQAGHLADSVYAYSVINRMKHICRVTITGTFNILNATYTTLDFNSEISDVFGYHDPAVPSRITVPAGVPTGWYRATGLLGFPSNATGNDRILQILDKTGGLIAAQTSPPSGEAHYVNANGLVEMAAGDWITAKAYQDSTSTLSVGAILSVQRICDS